MHVLGSETLLIGHSAVGFLLTWYDKVLYFNFRRYLLLKLRDGCTNQSTCDILLGVVSYLLEYRLLVSWWTNFIFNILSLRKLHPSISIINLSLNQLKAGFAEYKGLSYSLKLNGLISSHDLLDSLLG